MGKGSAKNHSGQVHFLYGSKPQKAYQAVERRWFGGIHGGHVGISLTDPDSIISFGPHGTFHYLAHDKQRHSHYTICSLDQFKTLFDNVDMPVKYASVTIPVTDDQYEKLQRTTQMYLFQTPYDYAFLGMRCGAGAYDLLAQAGIMKRLGRNWMVLTIFYPRCLRKRVFRLASQRQYPIVVQQGRDTRKWEKD